jgi:hypothetical protein
MEELNSNLVNHFDNFSNIIEYELNSENNSNTIKLSEKFDIKFYFLCQLFESCLKGKTKSKVK